jgi:AraC-like DNA-binding protein
MPDPSPAWDLLLRGAVAGILLFHVVHLAGPGPRASARTALGLFTLALIAYLFCQRPALLLQLPLPLALGSLALCTSATAWLWLASRGLFDDGFAWRGPEIGTGLAMVVLGLAANAPRLLALHVGAADPGPTALADAHALAMVAFTAAALWEVLRGWRDDLVEPRRAARRWVALGIGLYAALALAVELAIRGRPVGMVLPALHVLGIGLVALAMAVLVARRSLDAILGLRPLPPEPERGLEPPAAAVLSPTPRTSAALLRLQQAMSEQHAYRREGLTLAALASDLGLGEAALRALINQELGFRNFNGFLHHHRLQEAAGRLAAEDRPILSIALESGYGSIGPFNRAFRQRFGMTPTEYRAAHRLTRQRMAG